MRLLIVDDHILFREGLTSLLSAQDGFEVVGEVGSGAEAVEKVMDLHPDLVLMEVGLKDGSGLETISNVISCCPDVKVIVLTLLESDDTMISAIRSGARGYLLKNTPLNKLTATLKAVENGEAGLSRKMTVRVLQELAQQRKNGSPNIPALNSLTDREIEVLRYLGTGASNDEIAEKLFIAHNTVKNHIHNILSKLNLKNRREAARLAEYKGLVNSGHDLSH